MKPRLLAAGVVVTLGLLLLELLPSSGPGPSLARPPAGIVPDHVRERVQRTGWVRVLVELRTAGLEPLPEGGLPRGRVVAQRHDIAQTQARVMSRLGSTKYRVIHRYATVPLMALEVRPDSLAELEASSFYVKRIIEDTLNAANLAESVPLVEADQAWASGFDGTGTTVAIVDTGVDANHPFLAGKVVEEACYSSKAPGVSKSLCPNGQEEQVGAGAAAPCPLEGCWHGTHVAGIAAGNGESAAVPFSGVAKGADVMAVQVFSRFDSPLYCGGAAAPCALAWTSDVIAGLERVYLLRDRHRFAAVNLSLGGGDSSSACDDDPQKLIIDNLRSAAIATVAAAGNGGSTSSLGSPACISTAVSVGSTTKTDVVSSFSNVAPFLKLFAPGEGIVSSIPDESFAMASGTSMATPHVTGAWAVLRQAAPDASVDEVLAALQQTGVPITDTRSGTGTTVPRIRIAQAIPALLGDVKITGVSPSAGARGTTLDVTTSGINFQSGAVVGFGAGVTINATTFVSSGQLVVNLTIAAAATLGGRDVTVTNPDGKSATLAGGFTVKPAPPTLTLSFGGKLRDRVGQSTTALAPDGALDGTLTVRVEPGSGDRTVTGLKLESTSGGIWDTVGTTGFWALGAASSLDSGLLNDSTAAVAFPVADGGSFVLFAADFPSSTLFATGTGLTLTATFADGTTAAVTTTVRALPAVTGITPAQGGPGTTLEVTISGSSFADGATVGFGAGITVGSTTFVSASALRAKITIAATAAPGPRDVTVTNPDGGSVVAPRGFSVTVLTLAYPGKVRDRVGQNTTALAPDGTLDGTFTVGLVAGSGSRSVTSLTLRTSSGGVWDTIGSTPTWALGAAGSLDGPLFNDGSAAVSFTVPDGGSFVLFAADFSSSTLFAPGTTVTLTATFADGTTATAQTVVGTSLAVGAVTPTGATPGATLDVTLSGSGFQDGGTVTFGADVTISAATVASPTQITASLAVATTAAPGPRDVRVTNPDGQSATLPGGFTIAAAPATLSLAYDGKLRDRVGPSTTAVAPDGALDGTFAVRLERGSGDRSVTALELRSSNGGLWDTLDGTVYWALGAAADLESPLLNSANAAVSFGVADGGGFVLFAADTASGTVFAPGTTFTLTAKFADGTTATTATTLPVPPMVSSVTPAQATRGMTLDVTIDGSNFQTGATAGFGPGITVTSTASLSQTQLRSNLTIAADAALGPRDVTVTNPNGLSATLVGGFGVNPPPPTLTMAYPGMLRDRVGRVSTALSPDSALDGTFTVRLEPGSGDRTVTALELRSSSGGIWDTVAATGFWALGAARSLDGTLLNDSSTAAVSFAVADGGGFVLFAADFASGTLFAPGTTFTLTARFADGTTATATATVGTGITVSGMQPRQGLPGTTLAVTISGSNFAEGATAEFGAEITVNATTFVSAAQLTAEITILPGAALGPRDVTVTNPGGESATLPGAFTVTPLSLQFLGKLRDRVGQNTTALSPDGLLDGAFTVQLQAGDGARTVTALRLEGSGGGIWDTVGSTPFWALGAADGLDSPLLNAADASVAFTVPDGGSFVAFAGDLSPSLFGSGRAFTLTVTFVDGTTATGTTTVSP